MLFAASGLHRRSRVRPAGKRDKPTRRHTLSEYDQPVGIRGEPREGAAQRTFRRAGPGESRESMRMLRNNTSPIQSAERNTGSGFKDPGV